MPTMVKMRVTPRMPPKLRRIMSYRTRMMVADDGDEFEVGPSDARILRKAKYAEDVGSAPAPRPRGRPPKAREPEPESKQAVADEPKALEEHTVAELREMAEQRGHELPAGYVTHSALIGMLRGEDE